MCVTEFAVTGTACWAAVLAAKARVLLVNTVVITSLVIAANRHTRSFDQPLVLKDVGAKNLPAHVAICLSAVL